MSSRDSKIGLAVNIPGCLLGGLWSVKQTNKICLFPIPSLRNSGATLQVMAVLQRQKKIYLKDIGGERLCLCVCAEVNKCKCCIVTLHDKSFNGNKGN